MTSARPKVMSLAARRAATTTPTTPHMPPEHRAKVIDAVAWLEERYGVDEDVERDELEAAIDFAKRHGAPHAITAEVIAAVVERERELKDPVHARTGIIERTAIEWVAAFEREAHRRRK